jgi:hypothetical protein
VICQRALVLVRWEDADSSSTRVLTEAGDEYHKPVIMETVGWLLKNDPRGVSVVCEAFLDEGVRSYRGHTFIPRGMVLAVRTLRKGAK